MFGIDDSRYQPFHENGNLFSYPQALEQIEGYNDRKELTGSIEWSGPEFNQNISLTQTKGEQQIVSKKVKKGIISEAFSVVDSMFKTNFVKVPNLGNPQPFNRTTRSTESLNIKLPGAYSVARYNMLLDGYLDPSGAMRMAFAVKEFKMNDTPWNDNSLYAQKPDPSLVLPQKFVYVQRADGSGKMTFEGFQGNDNDQTALEMKGVRFYASDYGMESSPLLLKGSNYKISVPVYNASFVDAGSVKVSLYYASGNRSNAEKTKIDDQTVELKGWGESGNNRTWAEFDWTPALTDGSYYLFAEIDSDNAIDEIRENRRNEANEIADYGGNNLGYVKISVMSEASNIYDRTSAGAKKAKKAHISSVSAAASEEEVIAGEAGYITLNGIRDFGEFWSTYMASADAPVPVEVELFLIDELEEYAFPTVYVTAYRYTADAPESVKNSSDDVSEEYIDAYFVSETMSFFPGVRKTFTFLMDPNPDYINNDFVFEFELAGYEDYGEDEDIEDGEESEGEGDSDAVSGSGGGGCGTLSGGLGLLALIAIFRRKIR